MLRAMHGVLAFSGIVHLFATNSVDTGQCAGARAVDFRFVHVPKAGGMTLMCTFSNSYRQRLTPCRTLELTRVPVELEGRHRTFVEFQVDDGFDDATTRRVERTCHPMITMLAHPVRRFLSAFNHRPPEDKVTRLLTCYFMACRRGSELMKQHMLGTVSANDFALWPNVGDVEFGHNMAVKYLGGERLFYAAHDGFVAEWRSSHRSALDAVDSWQPIHQFALRNDTEGRAALARAKRRLEKMAFVGLVERFSESIALLEARVGVKAPGLCVCNVNPFKEEDARQLSRAPAAAEVLSSEAKERIVHDNALDVELYAFAQQLFASQLREHKNISLGDAAGARFHCERDRTFCEITGEHGGDDSGTLVPEAQYRNSNVAQGRTVRGGRHACVYPCPLVDRKSRERQVRSTAEKAARKVCAKQMSLAAGCLRRMVDGRMEEYRFEGVPGFA